MADLNCGSCGEKIRGEIVWCNPLRSKVPDDSSGQSGQFVAVASSHPQSAGDAPYHPKCFEEMFGHKWERAK